MCARDRTRAHGLNTMSVKHARRYPTPVLPVDDTVERAFDFLLRGCCCCRERPSKTSNALGRPRAPLYCGPYTIRDSITNDIQTAHGICVSSRQSAGVVVRTRRVILFFIFYVPRGIRLRRRSTTGSGCTVHVH